MKISDIKKQSSLSLEGSLSKAILIAEFYTIINLIIQILLGFLKKYFTEYNGLFLVIQLVLNIAILPFAYGLISSLVKVSKDEKIGVTDFINIAILNYTKVIKLFVGIFIRVLIPVALNFVFIVLLSFKSENAALNTLFSICFIASLAYLLLVALNYVLTLFVYYSDSQKSTKEILDKSKNLMKHNKGRYLLLVLSFILWFIIFALIGRILNYFIINKFVINCIMNLCFALITPSITISQYLFYEDLESSKN